jgi:hypothetical protein
VPVGTTGSVAQDDSVVKLQVIVGASYATVNSVPMRVRPVGDQQMFGVFQRVHQEKCCLVCCQVGEVRGVRGSGEGGGEDGAERGELLTGSGECG